MPSTGHQADFWRFVRLYLRRGINVLSIVRICKNLKGYQTLMRLSSEKMITEQLNLAACDSLQDLFGLLPEGEGFCRLSTMI